MKRLWIRFLLLVLFLAAVMAAVNLTGRKLCEDQNKERIIVTNRITEELHDGILKLSSGSSIYPVQIASDFLVDSVFYDRRNEWESIYGKYACPSEVTVHIYQTAYIAEDHEGRNDYVSDSQTEYLSGGAVISYLVFTKEEVDRDIAAKGNVYGLVEYHFDSLSYEIFLLLMNVVLILTAILLLLYTLWISVRILMPFRWLSDYPARLSKGELTEKLPESRGGFFGNFIWGINMLSDKLENDRTQREKQSLEHVQHVTTLVHGIKTPTANIKLLAEAIATGLYNPDGAVYEKDAELAEKIKVKADEIEALVSETLNSSSTAIFEYDPQVEPFYRSKLVQYVKEEYENRLKLARIPFQAEMHGDLLIKSDFDGVCRILRQLMDNAIKYGDGTGIILRIEKNDEGHFITVSNNGKPLPESEISFVFNNLWRGSNAGDVKGSGIGLYEARVIARALGGDIRMRTGENRTEVVLFLP